MTDQIERRGPERRALVMQNTEVRAAADDSGLAGTIAGRAIVYGSLSEDLGGWREIIMPGACTDVLATDPDVRMPYLDHQDLPVGRTRAGTLRLSESSGGVDFEVDVPDTEPGRALVVAVERGDVDQCSFRFAIDWEDPDAREWIYPDGEDTPIRQLNKIAYLYDVCLVTFPAYEATSAGMRSLDDHPPEEIPVNPAAAGDVDLRQRRLALRTRA